MEPAVHIVIDDHHRSAVIGTDVSRVEALRHAPTKEETRSEREKKLKEIFVWSTLTDH